MRWLLVLCVVWGLRLLAGPVVAPDRGVMALDELGMYTVGYAYRGQPEQQFPLGWSGVFEEQTGVACAPFGMQDDKAAFLLHCPWRHGVGLAFQQFTFSLPRAPRITLRGATALATPAVEKSDGAVFRVFANGEKLLEVLQTNATWRPFEFDLTAYAGKTLTLRFETDPGPKDNAAYDFSLWGERTLVLEGFNPPSHTPLAPPPLPLQPLCSSAEGGVAPRSGFAGKTSVALQGDTAVFSYDGKDGRLTYRWQRPTGDTGPLFGALELTARQPREKAVRLPLATDAIIYWTQPVQPGESRWEPVADGMRCVRTFRDGEQTATLRLTGRLHGKSLLLEAECDQPWVRIFNAGSWGPALRRSEAPVPYYSGTVCYLPAENLFTNAFLDWTASAATAQQAGARANYAALTDGSRNCLHETAIFTAAWHLAEALPNIPNPPSPYRAQLGGRIVLDLWGTSFRAIHDHLQRLADYGIRDAVALVHNWQRSGYDNALPMHLPANPALGGDKEMHALVDDGAWLGFLVALHENYDDYYPNYDFFTQDDVALDSTGKPQPAWYNASTRLQSFAVKPTAMLRLAHTQSPEIHSRFGTNADYLDVHSGVPPWFHVDLRAGEADAGAFRQVWQAHRQLWQFERETHGGPVFGEGNNHWYWSGYLDGVEAQFGQGWPAGEGMHAPLLVDFDLLKIHPLQCNHGMGYFARWWGTQHWDVPPLAVLDQYRMQEVAFGHAGFPYDISEAELPLVWLEHYLVGPVAARYAGANPVEIRYDVNGRWVDATAAAKADRCDRVRVRYDNGLSLTANSRAETLRAGGLTLPQFGWLAEGAGVTAYTALRDGVLVDYAETPESIFANARCAQEWRIWTHAARPLVAEFTQLGPRSFRVHYRWKIVAPLKEDFTSFVHFTSTGRTGEQEISFQQDHRPTMPTMQWAVGDTVSDGPYTIVVPERVEDGDYSWRIGLFLPTGNARVPLLGVSDGDRRIILGTLSIRDHGQTLTFTPSAETPDAPADNQRVNVHGAVIDFGPLRTDGSVALCREGDDWVLRPYPRDRAFTLELQTRRFSMPTEIRSENGATPTVTPTRHGNHWRLPLNGASTYRWPAERRR